MLGYSAIASGPIAEGAPLAVSVTSVSVSPFSSVVAGGGTLTFTATVNGTGAPPQTVTWSVVGGGSITSGGILTIPSATSSIQVLTITATSTFDGSKSGTATLTVSASGGGATLYGRKFKTRISRIHGFSGFSGW
jgi:hypothetical protein